MAVRDLEAFLRQAAANFDPNLDATVGSPFDNKIIQPLVRRVGTDPFTVDLSTFLFERLRQAYPLLATDEGDNITDLLIKPITLLWDPVVRENTRVRRGLSFADPTTLTLEEADSLGGNFFIPRRRGRFARGTARIFFSQPQDVSISQNNFVTSRGGLVFFPTALQSIRTNEMLINVGSSGLYFFDVTVVAENPGTAYNIDANSLNAIANLNAAVRVTNVSRFRAGEDEEDAVAYVSRLEQSLGEKSLVTLRGIAAKVLENFPEVNRLNVVGFNDPEMQRDKITGGGLGPILASGSQAQVLDDTEGMPRSRRINTTEANFDNLIGRATGFVLTLVNASSEPVVDIPVRGVVDQNTIDLEEQVLILGTTGVTWMLRKNELTLSNIPGGILFPNTVNGELRIANDEIHIGGAFDVHVRASEFDESILSISNVFDDDPAAFGLAAQKNSVVGQEGFILADYATPLDDSLVEFLGRAAFDGWTLQVEEGPNAGTYRVLESTTTGIGQALLVTDPAPINPDPVDRRWRLFDVINIDLLEPKETRISGQDLITTQGTDVVTTAGGINFDQFGVAKGDVLRILNGRNAGDYSVASDPLVPSFSSLQLDRPLPFSSSNLDYAVFRPSSGGMQMPFVRVRSIELLDSSSQPQGSFIPYAKPVDVQSRAFQNPARGVKYNFRDASLGLVSASADPSTQTYTLGVGATLQFYFPTLAMTTQVISLSPGVYTVDQVVLEISTQLFAATGFPGLATRIDDFHFGIRPAGNGFIALTGGTARNVLFGGTQLRTTADITTPQVPGGWGSLNPAIDFVTGLDTAQVVNGRNVGFFGGPFVSGAIQGGAVSQALMPGRTYAEVQNGRGLAYFAPDVGRRVIIGTRSIGSVRVFFLEPTTFEVDANTVFTIDRGDSGVLRFMPDATLSHQQIPPLPGGEVPADGQSSDGGSTFTSSSQDFLRSGINPGDTLVVENQPLLGSLVLPNEIANLAGKTLTYTIDGGSPRTVVFVRDDPTLNPGEVSRQGAVEQINASIGLEVASLDSDRLKFSSDLPFTVVSTSTSLDLLLDEVVGFTPARKFSDANINNESPHAGKYRISSVGTTELNVDGTFPANVNWSSSVDNQTFRVLREGVQRISTTQMESQTAEAGLYYADIELVSEGAGDAWNINGGLQMTVEGYYSEGYYLTTDDENMVFSALERPRLVISRSILESGVDDDPRNATQVTGQNIQITYERSSTVQNVQDFMLSEVERVVCASPLSRHLVPHFVRTDIEYFGGSDESVVLPDIEKYVRDLFPSDSLDSSDLQRIVNDRGATKVTNPLTLIAIVHRTDRTIYIQRSQNSLSTTRLAAFIPDRINVVRNVAGGETL